MDLGSVGLARVRLGLQMTGLAWDQLELTQLGGWAGFGKARLDSAGLELAVLIQLEQTRPARLGSAWFRWAWLLLGSCSLGSTRLDLAALG